jgi:tetratricopeptide (TPR) repeat protein
MTFLLLLALSAAPQESEKKVREALATLEKALGDKDESVGDLFDLPRLVKEMERGGAIPTADDDGRFRYYSARRLEQNLGTVASAPGARMGGWGRIRPLSVRLNATGDEAETLCRVMIGGRDCKFRFWLVREGQAWKAFDMEKLDGSFRLSVIGLQYTPGVHDDDARQALRDGVMTFQRGALYLAEGKPEAAREAMAMARRSSPPERVESWIDLVDGQALSALGDHELALKLGARALSRQKDFALAHRLMAVSHAALREYGKAIAAGKEYLKLVGDEAEGWRLIGEAHEKLDQPELAIEAYRKAADCDAEDYLSRMDLGRILARRRRAAEAKLFLSAAVKLAPVDEELFESAADLLDFVGAHAEALEIAEEAAVRRPDDAAVLLRRGRALRKLGRSKDAEETLRRAAETDLEDRELRWEFVLALAQAGKDREAQERLETAAKGDYWYYSYLRAFVHAAAGRSARALEELKPVLAVEGNLENILTWIEKEPVFEKVRSEGEAETLLAPARATRDYWKARQDPKLSPEDMLRTAEERIQALPGYALAYYDQGQALRRLKRYAEAEQAIRKALERTSNQSLFLDGLGRSLAEQGKLAEALETAELLLKKSKAEEHGLDLRVAAYALAGKRDAALRALKELLEKHPDWHPAALSGPELDEFRKLPAAQDLFRKARAKLRK